MSRRASLVFSMLTACGPGDPAVPPIRELAGVRVATADGVRAEIERYRGRPLLVNFWATWCAPCVEELPDLQRAAQTLREAGGEVLGVAVELTAPGQAIREVVARLPDFARERGIEYPILLYGESNAAPLWTALDLPGRVPTTIAVDSRGVIVARHAGRASAVDLDALVRAAIGR